MQSVFIDTHVLCWLYEGNTRKLSKRARVVLEKNDLSVSAAVILETQLLKEIGRLRVAGRQMVAALQSILNISIDDASLDAVVESAESLSWTRDPFDRLIVANVIVQGGRLVTQDYDIRKNFRNAVWD